jgi:hypothetical protein
MPTLKTGTGSIEVSSARVVRQAERMGKLSEPRRAHRLEKAKALLASGAGTGEKGEKGGKGGKGGKKKKADKKAVSPALKGAAAIVLGQGIAEL